MTLGRRNFLKTAGMGLVAAGAVLTPQEAAKAQAEAEKMNLERIAANPYGVRNLFKRRPYNGPRRSRRRREEPADVMNDPNAAGSWDQMEGCKYEFKQVMTALTTPTPVI